MTGPEPRSAELIATDAKTALPWQIVRDLPGRLRLIPPRLRVPQAFPCR